ncbi:hypothetical protein [Microbacterium sp. NPDC087665]|uniref:hypothetical protein n=1 Tax=Microbacterium sp. NPDC087665 TaxID=3364194 RepID=UPI0038033622
MYIDDLRKLNGILLERFGRRIEIDASQESSDFITVILDGVHSFSFGWSKVPGQSLGFVHNLPGNIRQTVLLGEDTAFISNTEEGLASALDRIEAFCSSPKPYREPNFGILEASLTEVVSGAGGVSKLAHLQSVLRSVFEDRFAVARLAPTLVFVLDERFVFEVAWDQGDLDMRVVLSGGHFSSDLAGYSTRHLTNSAAGIGTLVRAADEYCRAHL